MIGKKIYDTLEELSQFSKEGPGVTRLFLSKEHKEAGNYLENLMKEAGLITKWDNIGNVIGEYFSPNKDAKTLVIASHFDTVICGGKYDGALGIILPLLTFKEYLKNNKKLDFNFKLVAVGDEEGIRYSTLFAGSSVLAGSFTPETLDIKDIDGITLKDALIDFGLDPNKIPEDKIENIDTYLEIHIEQGPVLESMNLPLGIVSAIQGTERYEIEFNGMAGHAGTIPMNFRRDAGVGAGESIYRISEFAKNVEGLVATVGRVEFFPGAINVIPGKAKFLLDIRSLYDNLVKKSILDIEEILKEIATKNNLTYSLTNLSKAKADLCNEETMLLLEEAFKLNNQPLFRIPSGAGHDAQTMCKVAKMGMIFVRCKEGISHNPLESVTVEDLDITSKVLTDFFTLYK